MSHSTKNLFPITTGPNPLHVLKDNNGNNKIIAVGNPDGATLKNTFKDEGNALTENPEEKLVLEEGLDKINPKDFYGGVAHKKSAKRRRASRKTNKRRSSKKQKSRRNKKSKSKHTK